MDITFDRLQTLMVQPLPDAHYTHARLVHASSLPIPEPLVRRADPQFHAKPPSRIDATCLFPIIHRAYITIDETLYMWDYLYGGFLQAYKADDIITAVHLLKPSENVLVPSIPFVIVISTLRTVSLVALVPLSGTGGLAPNLNSQFGGSGGMLHASSSNIDFALEPTPIRVSSEDLMFTKIVSTLDGRIFMSANDCSLYEFSYGIVGARLVNLCTPSFLQSLLPSWLNPTHSATSNEIVDLAATKDGSMLVFALRSSGLVECWRLGKRIVTYKPQGETQLTAIRVVGDGGRIRLFGTLSGGWEEVQIVATHQTSVTSDPASAHATYKLVYDRPDSFGPVREGAPGSPLHAFFVSRDGLVVLGAAACTDELQTDCIMMAGSMSPVPMRIEGRTREFCEATDDQSADGIRSFVVSTAAGLHLLKRLRISDILEEELSKEGHAIRPESFGVNEIEFAALLLTVMEHHHHYSLSGSSGTSASGSVLNGSVRLNSTTTAGLMKKLTSVATKCDLILSNSHEFPPDRCFEGALHLAARLLKPVAQTPLRQAVAQGSSHLYSSYLSASLQSLSRNRFVVCTPLSKILDRASQLIAFGSVLIAAKLPATVVYAPQLNDSNPFLWELLRDPAKDEQVRQIVHDILMRLPQVLSASATANSVSNNLLEALAQQCPHFFSGSERARAEGLDALAQGRYSDAERIFAAHKLLSKFEDAHTVTQHVLQAREKAVSLETKNVLTLHAVSLALLFLSHPCPDVSSTEDALNAQERIWNTVVVPFLASSPSVFQKVANCDSYSVHTRLYDQMFKNGQRTDLLKLPLSLSNSSPAHVSLVTSFVRRFLEQRGTAEDLYEFYMMLSRPGDAALYMASVACDKSVGMPLESRLRYLQYARVAAAEAVVSPFPTANNLASIPSLQQSQLASAAQKIAHTIAVARVQKIALDELEEYGLLDSLDQHSKDAICNGLIDVPELFDSFAVQYKLYRTAISCCHVSRIAGQDIADYWIGALSRPEVNPGLVFVTLVDMYSADDLCFPIKRIVEVVESPRLGPQIPDSAVILLKSQVDLKRLVDAYWSYFSDYERSNPEKLRRALVFVEFLESIQSLQKAVVTPAKSAVISVDDKLNRIRVPTEALRLAQALATVPGAGEIAPRVEALRIARQ
eukprot:ANDGO_04267.mRNA.1 putative nucleoporin C890.06